MEPGIEAPEILYFVELQHADRAELQGWYLTSDEAEAAAASIGAGDALRINVLRGENASYLYGPGTYCTPTAIIRVELAG